MATNHYAAAPRDLLARLKQLPLWDENEALLGVSQRQAANVLDRIGSSDPTGTERIKLAETLHKQLRMSGFNQYQAEALEYLAMRLGMVPKISLSQEMYDVLSKTAVSKMNGHGLTAEITQELIAISRIQGERRNAEPKLPHGSAWPPSDPVQYMKTLYQGERSLPHRHILTGRIDPKRDLMPPKRKP